MALKRFEARWIRTDTADYSAMMVVPGREFTLMLLGQVRGEPQTISSARSALASAGHRPLGITNAGIFHTGQVPVGLFIEGGITKRPLDLQDGHGNFYMKPNGVFSWGPRSGFSIELSEDWSKRPDTLLATQSGPMLLKDGRRHPAFREDSVNTAIRSGVGITSRDKVVFAISDTPVTFWDFAGFFLSQGCESALYLDGAISDMWTPIRPQKRQDRYAGLICIVENPR